MSIDFDALNRELLLRSPEILFEWWPAGRRKGNRFVVGSLAGEAGESLSIDINTGVFADFASDNVRGKDLIALYAFKENLTQIEAARRLGAVDDRSKPQPSRPAKAELVVPERVQDNNPPVPEDAPPCRFAFHTISKPSSTWTYRDAQGRLLGHTSRHDLENGKKEFRTWRWDTNKQRWHPAGFADPRPLYGLDDLAARPEAKVFMVEGEKCVDNGRRMIPQACWTTWPNGAPGAGKADLTPLYGREVYLWPDADEPGQKAMLLLANKLLPHCKRLHFIETNDMPEGWDVADAVDAGMDYQKWKLWAAGRRRDLTEIQEKAAQDVKEKEQHDPPKGTPPPYQRLWIEWDLIRTESSGLPIPNLDNVVRIFEHDPTLLKFVNYDEFYRRVMSNGKFWTDADDIRLTLYLQRVLGLRKIAKETVRDAATTVAMEHKTHAVRDWLMSLKWDGTKRISRLMPEYFGSKDNEYTQAVGQVLIVSMVARAMIPGCKADTVVVFEGKQGIRKSSALEALASPAWFSTAHHEVTDKDFLQALRGKWFIEIAELDSFQRSELEAVKSMVSRPFDTYRVSYGHHSEDWPRQGVFAASTNKDNWNVDETGARRFLPIRCHAIDVLGLRRWREQIFAEGLEILMRVPLDQHPHDEVERKDKHADWWMTPREMTEREQDDRYEDDPWTDAVRDHLGLNISTVTITELLSDAVKLEVPKQTMRDQHRVGRILRRLGWEKSMERSGASVRKCWKLPDHSTNDF